MSISVAGSRLSQDRKSTLHGPMKAAGSQFNSDTGRRICCLWRKGLLREAGIFTVMLGNLLISEKRKPKGNHEIITGFDCLVYVKDKGLQERRRQGDLSVILGL